MSAVPHYRDQAATLDPKVEIPDNAPLAMSHDEDKAADVQEANATYKDAVEAEAKAEPVGAREPGEEPSPKKSSKKSD